MSEDDDRASGLREGSPLEQCRCDKGVSPFERRKTCVAFHLLTEGSQSKTFFL